MSAFVSAAWRVFQMDPLMDDNLDLSKVKTTASWMEHWILSESTIWMACDFPTEPKRALAFDLQRAMQMVILDLPKEPEKGAETAALFAECAIHICFGL